MQDLVSAFHAIETRHVQVEDDDIWPEFLGLFDCFATVSGFATHLPSENGSRGVRTRRAGQLHDHRQGGYELHSRVNSAKNNNVAHVASALRFTAPAVRTCYSFLDLPGYAGGSCNKQIKYQQTSCCNFDTFWPPIQ